ncbi:hypothetical protein MNBD_CHLOROFLEXI01-4919 [hydrothermal vent metagenome]|uniref:Pentapeptide repeat family protein n=1 Tax=hydrothermal vent metagenome TaxID=652676 RepID=A0A3B0VQM0_9ZZZZ
MSNKYRSRFLKIIIVVFIILLLSIFIWILPELILPNSSRITADAEKLIGIHNEYRKIIAQVIGGAVILYGIYNTLIRIEGIERNIEIAQEGQITDRFTSAIEQLSHDNIEMKIGGIYALERISIDSPKDYWTVMEVLTAFLRRTSSLSTIHDENKNTDNDIPPRRPIEIQTTLNVIVRRKWFELETKEDRHPDLSLTNLRNAYLGKANLSRTNLWRYDISYAYLGKANLQDAYLGKANLKMADLNNANLQGANLKETDLRSAKGLTVEQLSKVKTLYKANLDSSLESEIKQRFPDLLEPLA